MSQLLFANREVKAVLAFPALLTVIVRVVFLVVGVPIVYLSSKTLKLRPKPIIIKDPKREATLSFLVFVTVFLATFGLVAFQHAVINPTFQLDKRAPFTIDMINVLSAIFFYASLGLPLIIAMKRTGQNLGSIGMNRKDSGQTVALGLILSTILFTVIGLLAPSLDGGSTGFSPSLVYGLIDFAIVGFSEEIVMRGYIQTRLIAYRGKLKGLVATSLLFALWHFPKYYFQSSGVVLEALASASLIFPSGLLFGYVMLRSQNIISSSIFHVFGNWSPFFWRITGF